MTLGDLASQSGVLDIEVEPLPSASAVTCPTYQPCFPILKNFEQKKGINDLINIALVVVKAYKNPKSKETWTLWLQELQQFSDLP
mmetsp:Transcript_13543/g.21122  ORF Transcript_13543/g.21122 Transcript_13543/m.21122 type:complete len:85 (-) Transcript_13543:5483-5737(-)